MIILNKRFAEQNEKVAKGVKTLKKAVIWDALRNITIYFEKDKTYPLAQLENIIYQTCNAMSLSCTTTCPFLNENAYIGGNCSLKRKAIDAYMEEKDIKNVHSTFKKLYNEIK